MGDCALLAIFTVFPNSCDIQKLENFDLIDLTFCNWFNNIRMLAADKFTVSVECCEIESQRHSVFHIITLLQLCK